MQRKEEEILVKNPPNSFILGKNKTRIKNTAKTTDKIMSISFTTLDCDLFKPV